VSIWYGKSNRGKSSFNAVGLAAVVEKTRFDSAASESFWADKELIKKQLRISPRIVLNFITLGTMLPPFFLENQYQKRVAR
jgi:hypothetical protein